MGFFNFHCKINAMTPDKNNKIEGKVLDTNVSVPEQTEPPVDLQFLRNIIIKEYKKSKGLAETEWVTLVNENLSKVVLQVFTDDEMREILYATLYSPKTITEILEICQIPKTSGYRKIKTMMNNHILVPSGSTMKRNRRLKKYTATIEDAQIETEKDKIVVRIKFATKKK